MSKKRYTIFNWLYTATNTNAENEQNESQNYKILHKNSHPLINNWKANNAKQPYMRVKLKLRITLNIIQKIKQILESKLYKIAINVRKIGITQCIKCNAENKALKYFRLEF